jgi:hypothetical protein
LNPITISKKYGFNRPLLLKSSSSQYPYREKEVSSFALLSEGNGELGLAEDDEDNGSFIADLVD